MAKSTSKDHLMDHPIFWTAKQRADADAEWFAVCRRAEEDRKLAENSQDA